MMTDTSDRTYTNYGNKLYLNKLEIPLSDKLDAKKTFEIYEQLRPILPASKSINSGNSGIGARNTGYGGWCNSGWVWYH